MAGAGLNRETVLHAYGGYVIEDGFLTSTFGLPMLTHMCVCSHKHAGRQANKINKSIFVKLFYFMYMSVLHVCISGHHKCASSPRRPEEDIRSLELEL